MSIGRNPRLIAPTFTAVARGGVGTVTAILTAAPTGLDLGGVVVPTWVYQNSLAGPVLRARAADLLRVTLTNQLPTDTSVHRHGLALRNDMGGVPGLTQRPIPAGGSTRTSSRHPIRAPTVTTRTSGCNSTEPCTAC